MKIDPSQIIDSIDQYIFCKDAKGIYIYANPSFSSIAGIDHNDTIVGKTDYDLIWKEQADIIKEKDRKVLQGESILRRKEIQTRKNGHSQIIISRQPYTLNGTENILGVIGNFFDVNEHLVLETKGEFDETKKRLHLGFTPESLSASEIRICFYLIQGFPPTRIAKKINITIGTVRYHINNIKEKMQCNAKEVSEILMKEGIAWKILTLQHNMSDENEF